MRGTRWLAGLAALAFFIPGCFGARAETTQTEYLVNMTPEQILQLEEQLKYLGYFVADPDETFDADTRQAVESFQLANGLDVNGAVDDVTRQKLDGGDALSRQDYLERFAQAYQSLEPLRNGDISGQVQAMQAKLAEYGYFAGTTDGAFGEATQAAVERFQMVNGLNVTGEADGMTLMRLMNGTPITWQGYLSEMSCASGDVGLNVYVLQKKLTAMGYFDGDCTGSFGDLTQQAVVLFQADNELDDTGVADAATWEVLYSDTAVARRSADVAQLGDTGEQVTRIQQQLSALGYLSGEADGSYDFATETAMRLFQMANELPASGDGDADTLARLMSVEARTINDIAVQDAFTALMEGRSAAIQTVIADIASQMVGTRFETSDSELYPGFAFVQYVCVAAGLPVTQPEAVTRLADDPVEAAAEVGAGNIVAFQSAGSDVVTMQLTIGAGDGRVIYVKPEIGYVVMSYIEQMGSENIYRWAEEPA